MIDKILKQAGVDTVEELYNMYPDEASFIAAYPEFATKMKMGGTPEAIAIPRHKGRAIRETEKPEMTSFRKCRFNPASPVEGNSLNPMFMKSRFN